MLAAIIQKYLRHYSIAQIMQFIDGAIVVVGMYVFGVERALYAIIAVFLVTKVSDGIIEGLKFSLSDVPVLFCPLHRKASAYPRRSTWGRFYRKIGILYKKMQKN